MKQGKKFFDVYVAKIDNRYPRIQKEWPNATHMNMSTKFQGIKSVEEWANRQPEVTRRKYPPKVRIFEV